MADLHIDVPEEKEEETLLGKVLLRTIVISLCALIGFGLVILGYTFALFMELDLEQFGKYTSGYFFISVAIWIVVGLITPFARIQKFFEAFKGMNPLRALSFLLISGIFVLLYWYVLSFASELAAAVLEL